jgi:hypothetical protein
VEEVTRRVFFGVGRGLRWLGKQVVEALVEAVGEVVAAALACLLFGGFLALTGWGLIVAPRATALLVAAVVVLALYGGWRAWRDEPGVRRGLVVRLAIGWFVFVAFWLVYVITYCECV